jgi:hypothetical protein
MRYLTIILFTMLITSCGKLSGIKSAGEKVKQTVNACTETSVGTGWSGTSGSSVCDKDEPKEGIDTKISTVWDAHMMLW